MASDEHLHAHRARVPPQRGWNRQRRVVLADDSPETRATLRLWLGADDRFEVCGETATLRETLDVARDGGADLVLLDRSLPAGSPTTPDEFTTIRLLSRLDPPCRVVVLTGSSDARFQTRARKAGALASLQKGAPLSQVTNALLAAAEGVDVFSASNEPLEKWRMGVSQQVADAIDAGTPRGASQHPAPQIPRLAGDLHELRTSMVALQTYAATLPASLDRGDVATVRRVARGLERNVQRLDLLFCELTTAAEAEAGVLVLQRTQVNLDRLVTEVGANLQPTLVERELRVATGEGGYVYGDPVRLSELVTYLLLTAARSDRSSGPITLQTAAEDDEIVVEVSDTGPPLTTADLDLRSGAFRPISAQLGNGPELALAHLLATLHGGTLVVDSAAARTTFTLRLLSAARMSPGSVDS